MKASTLTGPMLMSLAFCNGKFRFDRFGKLCCLAFAKGKPSLAEAARRLELSQKAKEPPQPPKVDPSRVAIARPRPVRAKSDSASTSKAVGMRARPRSSPTMETAASTLQDWSTLIAGRQEMVEKLSSCMDQTRKL